MTANEALVVAGVVVIAAGVLAIVFRQSIWNAASRIRDGIGISISARAWHARKIYFVIGGAFTVAFGVMILAIGIFTRAHFA